MKRLGNIVTVRVSLLVFLTLVIAFPLSCSKKQSETKEIKIGAVLPLSGSAGKYGESAKKGIDLAVKKINVDEGSNGRKIRKIHKLIII